MRRAPGEMLMHARYMAWATRTVAAANRAWRAKSGHAFDLFIRRDLDGQVRAPAGPLVVEVGQLVERERAAEPAAQLGLHGPGHALQGEHLLGVRVVQPAHALLPLLPRAFVRHGAPAYEPPQRTFSTM